MIQLDAKIHGDLSIYNMKSAFYSHSGINSSDTFKWTSQTVPVGHVRPTNMSAGTRQLCSIMSGRVKGEVWDTWFRFCRQAEGTNCWFQQSLTGIDWSHVGALLDHWFPSCQFTNSEHQTNPEKGWWMSKIKVRQHLLKHHVHKNLREKIKQ